MTARRSGPVLILLGILGLALSIVGLVLDVAWIAQPFYAYAWWSYILVMDGLRAWRSGDSLLLSPSRRRLLPALAIGSVSFWFFFELLNLRFQNWYYVGVFELYDVVDVARGGLFVFACFSTVFLGIFETLDVLTAFGVGSGLRRPARPLPRWLAPGLQLLGLSMAAAAIVFPTYLAPLIWGSFTFLIDPWNYRRGARSLLRDIEVGDLGIVVRTLLAGLLCGFVWESLNFFAPQKWIYTVRGLEEFKLFEMPLLGFFGFPGLALDCIAGFALLSWALLGNRPWEHPGDLLYTLTPRRPWKRPGLLLVAAVQPLFWAAVTWGMMGINFGSLELRLEAVGLDVAEIEVLEEEGIHRPRQLVRHTTDLRARSELGRLLGWSEARMDEIRTRIELYAFKGIGSWYGELLESIGIERVEQLAAWDPEDLCGELEHAAERRSSFAPRVDMVRVWVLAARDRGILLRG